MANYHFNINTHCEFNHIFNLWKDFVIDSYLSTIYVSSGYEKETNYNSHFLILTFHNGTPNFAALLRNARQRFAIKL